MPGGKGRWRAYANKSVLYPRLRASGAFSLLGTGYDEFLVNCWKGKMKRTVNVKPLSSQRVWSRVN